MVISELVWIKIEKKLIISSQPQPFGIHFNRPVCVFPHCHKSSSQKIDWDRYVFWRFLGAYSCARVQEAELAGGTSRAIPHWEGTGLWAPSVFGWGLPPGRGQVQCWTKQLPLADRDSWAEIQQWAVSHQHSQQPEAWVPRLGTASQCPNTQNPCAHLGLLMHIYTQIYGMLLFIA